ncbi:hypothetical protein Tsubulata_033770 [Turnera subulata]|uniref:DUF4283 domain-containing protein n=1 Tax=Turnera subulata TaxID=218843 RepID=A0A9Q0GE77_9ROSI|nr:hypothetical protein Tsubulata_033770 [Turnera subulata]
MDSSTSLVDPTGLPCSKSAMALDLSRLDSLLRSDPAQLSISRGKNVTASVHKQDAPPAPTLVNNSTASCSDATSSLAVGGVLVSTSVEDTVAPIATASKSTWASVVTDSTPILQTLDFVQPILVSDSSAIRIPTDVIELGHKKYSMCLVGQFMGKAPRMGLIHAMFNKLWGRDGNIIVVPYKSDRFLIQFPTESSLSRALYRGPWHVGGIPLHLRLWDSKIQKVDFSNSLIPDWAEVNVIQSPNIVEDMVQTAPTTVQDASVTSPHSQFLHVSTSVPPALNNSTKQHVLDALNPQKARLIPADKSVAQFQKVDK